MAEPWFKTRKSILKFHVLNRVSANSLFLLNKHGTLPKKTLVMSRNVCLLTYPITVGAKGGKVGRNLGKLPGMPCLVVFLNPEPIFITNYGLNIRDTELNTKAGSLPSLIHTSWQTIQQTITNERGTVGWRGQDTMRTHMRVLTFIKKSRNTSLKGWFLSCGLKDE